VTTRLVAHLRAHATFGDRTQMSATTGERHAVVTRRSTTLDNIPADLSIAYIDNPL